MKRLTPWISLTFAVMALVHFLSFFDGRSALLTLFFFICFLADLVCTPLVRKRKEANCERRKEAAIEREIKCLAESEAPIRDRLAAGQLRYLVEWWEEDDLWIDENGHLLFIFTNGTERDFTLYEPIKKGLVSLLGEHAIKWEPRFSLHFDSVLLYPPALRGQRFYAPDGKVREELKV